MRRREFRQGRNTETGDGAGWAADEDDLGRRPPSPPANRIPLPAQRSSSIYSRSATLACCLAAAPSSRVRGKGVFVSVVPGLAPPSLSRKLTPSAALAAPPLPQTDPSHSRKHPIARSLLGALVLSFSAPTPNGSGRDVSRHPSTGAPVRCRVLEDLPQPTLPLTLAPDRQRQQTHLVHPIRRCRRIDL